MRLVDQLVSVALPITPRPLVRYFSRPYIAGTRTEDAFDVVRSLERQGVMSTLDILGEFVTSAEEARANADAYAELLRRIATERLAETHVSVKLTALGLSIDADRCLESMRLLLRLAEETDNFVRIDMEDSPQTEKTLDVYRTLRLEFPRRVGTVLQSRLRRTLDDIDDLSRQPANIRICKGIYLEPREIAYTDFGGIQRNFTKALEHLLERGAYVGIATHDEKLISDALGLITRFGLSREQYEFQMLLGVHERMRGQLVAAGHRMRVYVPFGEKWYQYSLRRLRENPQIAGHVLRAMFRRA